MRITSIIISILISIIVSSVTAQEEARLMRFPTIHGNQIVFSYAGNLYNVSKSGGIARRLTSDIGYEMFPRYSPDGSMIAFTGQYDGNTEVFVMPATGGSPTRLTFTATLRRDEISDRMGPNNIVMGWTPDGNYIIYRSRKKTFNDFIGHLYMVSLQGGMPIEIPLSTGGFNSFSPDGKKIAFNRVFREFRTWKYYKGGMADDIRIFDRDTKSIVNITNHVSQDIIPMWIGDDIYFISDRDHTMNLFAYNTNTAALRKITNYTDYDIKFPSNSKEAIVFEKGGYIYVFDIQTQITSKVDVIIADDLLSGRNTEKDASKNILSVDISPDGERLVFGARGDIFTVPYEDGITRNLTQSSGAHDRHAVWSPDGNQIAYLSDADGEFEIYIQKQDGSTPPVQLTRDADTYYFNIKWSPDGRYLLWGDKKMRLRYIDVNTKRITEVARNDSWEFSNYEWSPDSKWIAYTNNELNGLSSVKLFGLEQQKTFDVSGIWFRSYNPSFSRCGKYLFFVSDRDFNPIYSRTEWNHAYGQMAKIYFVNLSNESANPFAYRNNEVKPVVAAVTRNSRNPQSEAAKTDSTIIVNIDTNDMQSRIQALPIETAEYYNITSLNGKVYYMRYNNDTKKRLLLMYDFEKRTETELTECNQFIISGNSKKIMISKDNKYYVIDLPTTSPRLEKNVNLENMKTWVNLKEEWRQIFYESWRQMRDFFYVENMHGVNWELVKQKYEVFLPYVKHRHDLNYIIGEMISELNVGHAYVNGGDMPTLNRIPMGLLGATFKKDASGYFRIETLLQGASWSEKLRSPLTEPGMNIDTGDYIIAIDGRDLKAVSNIYELLINKANKAVELTVNNTPAMNGSTRKIIVKPIDDESELYYYRWVQSNIKRVNDATNGEVGYIHIPDMGPAGLNEFVKHFYSQLHKKALIIDDRGNGGGNVSPMILERLQRRIQRANMSRNATEPSQTPRQMILGPIVVLINQYSASDGDLFPYGVQKYGLGPVIGVRSWGGVVGIRGSLPFVDGATLNKPEFASYDAETGEWIIEGHGVDPDIVIDNDPYEEYMGKDAQLDKAIEEIMKALRDFTPLHPIPEGPDRSR
ncbi:MAG: PDZ domain-containing protein [Bacteroidales bacterium]|nr:PDZ domain-containing protein [Bacteroidales bacterium]